MTEQLSLIMVAAAVFVFTAIAVDRDMRTRRLPNWLTVTGFAAGIVFHVVAGVLDGGLSGGLSGLRFAMAGFGVGFGILFVLWLIGGGGGGDVKFAGAVGVWLGASQIFIAVMASAVIALAISIGTIVYLAIRPTPNTSGSLKKAFSAGRRLPYAVPLSLATWVVITLKLITNVGTG